MAHTVLSASTPLPLYMLWEAPRSTVKSYGITIQGTVPTDLYRKPLGQPFRVPDKAAIEQWEKQREAVMFAWKYKTLRRCTAVITIKGDKANSAELAAATMRLLQKAGVVESISTNCVRAVSVACGRARTPRIEVTLHDLNPYFQEKMELEKARRVKRSYRQADLFSDEPSNN